MYNRVINLLFFLSSISVLFVGCARIRDATLSQSQSKSLNVNCPLEFVQLSLCAHFTPVHYPIQIGQRTNWRLQIWRKSEGTPQGPFVDPGYSPFVLLWMEMPSESHGSFDVSTIISRDPEGIGILGTYEVSNVIFTMKGEWDVYIKLRNPDGSTVDEVISKLEI